MINEPLKPELLARILQLSDAARTDMFELLGATPLSEEAVAKLLTELEGARPEQIQESLS